MRICALILISLICFTSCRSSKRAKISTKKEVKELPINNDLADKIVEHALEYDGVRYKYGGTTKKGMDCSGLIMTTFKKENISLPRTTSDLSKYGDWIDLKTVQKGDLLFFATRKNSRRVNHVGIVTEVDADDVEFIHASTSKGVMRSKLKERYWYFAFVQARRVL